VCAKFVQMFLCVLYAVTQSSSIGQTVTGYLLAYCITVQTVDLGVEMDGYVLLNVSYKSSPLYYCFAFWLEGKSSDNPYVEIIVYATSYILECNDDFTEVQIQKLLILGRKTWGKNTNHNH
jgi:hypothetical protein